MEAEKRFWTWKKILFVVTLAGILFALHNDIIDCVKFWLNRTKPHIYDVQEHSITFGSKILCLELLINNPDSKNCSVISITLPKVGEYEVEHDSLSASPPITIPAGQTELIRWFGHVKDMKSLPDPNTLTGTVEVKFNTNNTSQKTINFTLYR